MKRHLLVVASCTECGFRDECGGLPGQQAFGGCFSRCGVDCGGPDVCKWMCPAKPSFVDDEREVLGLRSRTPKVLPPSVATLPEYVPMIRHGSSRSGNLARPVVALSVEDIFTGGVRAEYGGRITCPDSLRGRFRLDAAVDILVVSVSRDAVLEKFWALHKTHGAIAKLATSNVVGVTIPNYSSFDDAPRTYTLWNRRRMEIVAEELTAVGIAVIPHLNSAQSEDWDYWFDFLSVSSDLKYVAKEFGTGLRNPTKARNAIRGLAELQNRLGRDLHPIVVAGAQYATIIASYFKRATFVDSQPFIKTMMRQRGTSSGKWLREPRIGVLDDLLEDNIVAYASYLGTQLRRGARRAA